MMVAGYRCACHSRGKKVLSGESETEPEAVSITFETQIYEYSI